MPVEKAITPKVGKSKCPVCGMKNIEGTQCPKCGHLIRPSD